jgi:hypothetical protein
VTAPRELFRRRRRRRRTAVVAILVAAAFALGVAVGEALHDNPDPSDKQTIVLTFNP